MKALNDLINEIRQHKEGLETAILGGLREFNEYKSLTGEIRGLSFAQQLLIDLVRKLENDDD